MIRTPSLLAVSLAAVALPSLCHAQVQDPPSFESAISVVRAGIQANKTATVGQVMNLDDKGAAAFWPIYRRYEYDRSKLDDEWVGVIIEYTEKYPDLTDDQAKALAERMFDYQFRMAELKKKYFKEFNKSLPALKVTEFFQLERRIDLMVDMKVEQTLPPLAPIQSLVEETQ
jgi:hypothetical protein